MDVVKKIPKGKTLTYAEVARKAGSPRAFRAVGTMLKKNYNKNIPCHRVVKTLGGVGEYNRGGSSAKAKKLERESMNIV